MNYQLLSLSFCTQTRGRTGMDVTPLVFETSASTDSAIWAICWATWTRTKKNRTRICCVTITP